MRPLAPSLCRLAHCLHHWHACSGGRGLRRRLRSVLGTSGQRCHGNYHHHTISFIYIRSDWNIRSTSLHHGNQKTFPHNFVMVSIVLMSQDTCVNNWGCVCFIFHGMTIKRECSHDALFHYLFLWVSSVSAFTSRTLPLVLQLSRQRYNWQITLTNVAVHCGCETPAGIRIKVHRWARGTNSLTEQPNRHFIWSVTLGRWML